MVWYGKVRSGLVRYGLVGGLVCCGKVWLGRVRCGWVRLGMVRFGVRVMVLGRFDSVHTLKEITILKFKKRRNNEGKRLECNY